MIYPQLLNSNGCPLALSIIFQIQETKETGFIQKWANPTG
jgi:hypothetical protein